MEVRESLEALRQRQQALLQEYDRVVNEIQGLDLLQENTALRQKITDAAARCNQLETRYCQAADENLQLKLSLQEQILDEKLNTYFAAAAREHENRLTAAEAQAYRKIEELKKVSAQKLSESS